MSVNIVQPTVPIPTDLLPGWTEIMAYPLEKVRERLTTDGKLSTATIDTAVTEYRKFLSLVLMGNRGLAMTSKEVDEVWHTHILFTKDYADFCTAVFGRFLHHKPNVASDPITPGGGEVFRRAYQEVFGPLPSIWGGVTTALCKLDPPICNLCSQCNGCEECNCEDDE